MLLLSGEICGVSVSTPGDREADCMGWPLGVRPAVQFCKQKCEDSRWGETFISKEALRAPGGREIICVTHSVWPGLCSVCLTHKVPLVSRGLDPSQPKGRSSKRKHPHWSDGQAGSLWITKQQVSVLGNVLVPLLAKTTCVWAHWNHHHVYTVIMKIYPAARLKMGETAGLLTWLTELHHAGIFRECFLMY